jgi:hypothetical protein
VVLEKDGEDQLNRTRVQRDIEGKIKEVIEVTGRRGRRRRKLMDDRKERIGYIKKNAPEGRDQAVPMHIGLTYRPFVPLLTVISSLIHL